MIATKVLNVAGLNSLHPITRKFSTLVYYASEMKYLKLKKRSQIDPKLHYIVC